MLSLKESRGPGSLAVGLDDFRREVLVHRVRVVRMELDDGGLELGVHVLDPQEGIAEHCEKPATSSFECTG